MSQHKSGPATKKVVVGEDGRGVGNGTVPRRGPYCEATVSVSLLGAVLFRAMQCMGTKFVYFLYELVFAYFITFL